MFGLGWLEVGVIALVGVFVFGTKRIPELGSSLGKTLRSFKEELKGDDSIADEDKE